jgi:hypothetical protein
MRNNILIRIYRKLNPASSFSPHLEFGGSGITEDCFNWIRANVATGSSVLEFGAGLVSTAKLSQHYTLTSIGHDENYIGTFQSNYSHAPLSPRDGWYEVDKLDQLRHQEFELAIIDGPPGSGNRFGILLNLDFLKGCKFILVDDTDRPSEQLLTELLSRALNLPFTSFDHFSVFENNQ